VSDAHDPDHYKVGGIESIDVIRAKLSPEAFQGFCAGNVMKYIHRMGHKGASIDDARKARQYMGWLVESMEEQSPPAMWGIVNRGMHFFNPFEVTYGGVVKAYFETHQEAKAFIESKRSK
jgi:hypothetical protein